MSFAKRQWAPAVLLSFMLAACGGGGGDGGQAASGNSTASSGTSAQQSLILLEPGISAETGDSATDSIAWFNHRRKQVGLGTLTRNPKIDAAALGHSNYQTYNGITHFQNGNNPGYTGGGAGERLSAAGYNFTRSSYAFGEVIVRSGNPSGYFGSEELIAAIYHRFVIFEPVFKEAGAGAATASNRAVYITTNFAIDGLARALGAGGLVTYPFASQVNVARNFYSDTETPDPVASKNEVGYPISVHTDITGSIAVESFTVRPRGGAPLSTFLLTNSSDGHTPRSAAAIIPTDPLAPATTYDVQFTGTVDGMSVSRSWSFTTN
jgi:uncharacterized protein YkwD